MSVTFTKLFSSITASTVWCEDPETKVVWITMLAMSDRIGRVWGSIPGLAAMARVPVEDCRRALEKFLSPDPDSRSKECEGRRIEEIDGGWRLINYEKYREIRDEEERKEYKRQWIKKRRQEGRQCRQDVDNVDRGRPQYTKAEAEAEAEIRTMSLSGTDISKVFEHWKETHDHPRAKLDAKRQRVIALALKSYSAPDLCLAISGYKKSKHHMGQNDRKAVYDDIELFLRDAKHIEAGIKFSSQKANEWVL